MSKRWNDVNVMFGKKVYYLGSYKTLEDAERVKAKAQAKRDAGDMQHFGDWLIVMEQAYKEVKKRGQTTSKAVYLRFNKLWKEGNYKEQEVKIEPKVQIATPQQMTLFDLESPYRRMAQSAKEAIGKILDTLVDSYESDMQKQNDKIAELKRVNEKLSNDLDNVWK